jgi:hypothetical protein
VEGLAANAAATGAYLKDAVTRFAAGSPVLGDVRGAGLYLGVYVLSPETGAPSGELAAAIVNGMRERRVLISATGPHGSVLKIRPPLPFGLEHADQFLDAFSEVLTRTRPAADGQADPAVPGGQDSSASVLRVVPPGHLGIARPPWQQVAARVGRDPGPQRRERPKGRMPHVGLLVAKHPQRNRKGNEDQPGGCQRRDSPFIIYTRTCGQLQFSELSAGLRLPTVIDITERHKSPR